MTDDQGMSLNQIELLKRMKAIASDLWGTPGSSLPGEEDETGPAETSGEQGETTNEKPAGKDYKDLWKTADETIDWTDALAHCTPTDRLTGQRLWSFYHKHAAKVLEGDLEAYTEVLKAANPLGELTGFAEGITMRAVNADRLESSFGCLEEHMGKDQKLYLSAMGIRIARDLLACLPVSEVTVSGEWNGNTVFTATYPRRRLLHRNFTFIDPVAFSEECGAEFG